LFTGFYNPLDPPFLRGNESLFMVFALTAGPSEVFAELGLAECSGAACLLFVPAQVEPALEKDDG
jgi:hypothetical protein